MHQACRPLTPRQIVAELGMQPHPEGGFFVETFRDPATPGGRAASTAIYYLLTEGIVSDWHRVDAAEVWHFYAGAPLELKIADGDRLQILTLGADLPAGQRPQAVVPGGAWQSAASLGGWSLVGCTVAPGFLFEHFHLATEQEKRALDRLKA